MGPASDPSSEKLGEGVSFDRFERLWGTPPTQAQIDQRVEELTQEIMQKVLPKSPP
jgi:hypothetical protein